MRWHLPSALPALHPVPDPGRTFTGRAQSAGGGRSMPNSSSTRRLTPPARGPPSSGDPAILPSEPGSGQADWTGWQMRSARASRPGCGALRLRVPGAPALPCHPLLPLDARAASELLQPLHPDGCHGYAQGAKWRVGDCWWLPW